MSKSGYNITEKELDQEIKELKKAIKASKGKHWTVLLQEGY
tara:strand:- start:2051 stop:2173 length:123 start_codon:yes stop_codon:yes gene_type:complete